MRSSTVFIFPSPAYAGIMLLVVSGSYCPVSCLMLDLVRWLVVSVPTVLDAQGGFFSMRGQRSQLDGLFTASNNSGSRSMHVLYLYAHASVCSTKPSCSLMGPCCQWLIYPILSYPEIIKYSNRQSVIPSFDHRSLSIYKYIY